MDVRLSPEQRALVDAAAQVVDRLGPATVAGLADAERAAKLDAAVEAAGWRELRAADDAGAPWASGVEVALVAEELGRSLADTPFLGPTLAADLRRRAGAPAASGPETVLLTPDLHALTPRSPTANSWRNLPDTRELPPRVADGVGIDAGGPAATALVVVAEGDGWRLGTVDLGEPTVAVDLTRPLARPADGAAITGAPGQQRPLDDDDLTRVRALALAATSADLVGVMQGAVDLAAGYAKERRQFGTPVGSFQAVQHLLADALVQTEGARSITRYAAWAVDAAEPGEALVAGATAKAYAARAARTVCETAIQVHGGIGNTWECLAHVFLRRALLSTDAFGGVDASLAVVLDHRVGATGGLR